MKGGKKLHAYFFFTISVFIFPSLFSVTINKACHTDTMKTVFVTVGTTSFDDLIGTLTSDESVKVIISFINSELRRKRKLNDTNTSLSFNRSIP